VSRGRDEVKALPSDRLDLKRTAKPTTPVKRDDAKSSTPSVRSKPPEVKVAKPSAKTGDDKKNKW
jgi:hypothetical protein